MTNKNKKQEDLFIDEGGNLGEEVYYNQFTYFS